MKEIDVSKLTRDYSIEPLKYGEEPPKEDIEYIYLDCEYTTLEAAEYFGKSKTAFGRWITKHRIKRPVKTVKREITLTKEMLDQVDVTRLSRDFQRDPWKPREAAIKEDFEYLYLELNWSRLDVAEYLGTTENIVANVVKKYDLHKTIEQHQAAREHTCERKHGNKHTIAMKETRDKIKATVMERYGVESNLAIKEVHEKAQQTMLERYGKKHAMHVEQFIEKRKNTLLAKYGVEHAGQAEEVKENIRKSVFEKYGVNNVFELEEIQEKARKTCAERYGTHNVWYIPEVVEKIKQTNIERYGTEFPSQNPDIRQKVEDTVMERYGVNTVGKVPEFNEKARQTILDKYGVTGTSQLHVAHRENFNKEYWLANFKNRRGRFDVGACAAYHNVQHGCINTYLREFGIADIPRVGEPKAEIEIANFISMLDISVQKRKYGIIDNGQIDIYVPSCKLAIEHDGIMYHCQGRVMNRYIHPDYHLMKTKECNAKGVQLFHIFETEWKDPIKKKIWKSMIANKLGMSERIFARKTEVRTVSSQEAHDFCELNHLQGACKASVYLGLYHNDELVAFMSFGTARFNKAYSWELIRYCCKAGVNVVGGASKLLKHFRKEHEGKIISYANLRWSNGKLYEAIGFTKIDQTSPNYFYFKLKDSMNAIPELHNRIQFQKHKLADKLEKYDPNLTEKENMYNNGYCTIYDCGNLVYALD